ncbi:hypothetical protein vseg_019861 [Gypsophila vaccaria]
MSMLKGKVGFVIPKNNFSGSLVPVFKKSNINNTASEETNNRQQRKARWGADLNQEPGYFIEKTKSSNVSEQLATTRNDDQN